MDIKEIDEMNCLVELHLHLDGALSVENCKKIAKLQNINIPENDEEIKNLMTVSPDCKSLNEFLTKFDFAGSLLQTVEGVENAVKNLADELVEQGLIYAEIRFAPQFSTRKGCTQEQVVEAAIAGARASKLECNLICCCMRGNDNHEANMETVRVAAKYLNKGVCAIDLAGAEALYPTKDYAEIFEYAKELNVPYTIHAGEADGPESVKSAICFGTHRIGHGVRAAEDELLLDVIAKENITLEVCPTSNICTGVYESVENMPIKKFIDKGIAITINTDDSTVCGTTLKDELKKVASSFNLEKSDIIKFQINAMNAAFVSEDVKHKIIERINEM